MDAGVRILLSLLNDEGFVSDDLLVCDVIDDDIDDIEEQGEDVVVAPNEEDNSWLIYLRWVLQ